LRIKEQETRLTLQEHDDDDDGDGVLIFLLLGSTMADKILRTERQQAFEEFNFILISPCMELSFVSVIP